MIGYCLGIRVNDVFQERTCGYREHCAYYNVRLQEAFMKRDEYVELDTYNNKQCDLWKRENSETSASQTDGMRTH